MGGKIESRENLTKIEIVSRWFGKEQMKTLLK